MSKRQINHIIPEMFPNEKAICVLTRVDFDYIMKISTSMAWKIKAERAVHYDKIISISLGGNRTSRGEIFIADIKNIYTVEEVKELYRKGKTTPDIDNLIMHEKSLPLNIDAVFSERNLMIDKDGDTKRLVFIFDLESVKEHFLNEDYKGLAMPVFYLD